jgi:aryl-alcohol dehydrogenase-like predicted oxidoreductase
MDDMAHQVCDRGEVKNLCGTDSVQPRCNLLFRSLVRDLLPLCAEEAIAVIPYNRLAGRSLSGNHDRTAAPSEGTRFALRNAGSRYQRPRPCRWPTRVRFL